MAGMKSGKYFSVEVRSDWDGLVKCIKREGTPKRVHFMELFLDEEVKNTLCQRFDILRGINSDDPHFSLKREIAVQRFLGYDYARCWPEGIELTFSCISADDTAELARKAGRSYINEHEGPITNWKEFEAYPWPDINKLSVKNFEWYQKNLPEDMCIIACGGFAHFSEHLTWLMGYEKLCYALFEQRDLVKAICDKALEYSKAAMEKMLEFPRVKVIWGSDDMGFRSGTMMSPADLREFIFPHHKLMADMSHKAGRPYLIHSCGQLSEVMDDLINDVGIDGKHSFEDTIENVIETKKRYGKRIALIGGIDIDFLCRADETQVRNRVRQTLETCMPGGGYCLGTGNSVANYVPVENYLAMLDEGRKFKSA
jgi:uroporphyrinogen decarboxylase